MTRVYRTYDYHWSFSGAVFRDMKFVNIGIKTLPVGEKRQNDIIVAEEYVVMILNCDISKSLEANRWMVRLPRKMLYTIYLQLFIQILCDCFHHKLCLLNIEQLTGGVNLLGKYDFT